MAVAWNSRSHHLQPATGRGGRKSWHFVAPPPPEVPLFYGLVLGAAAIGCRPQVANFTCSLWAAELLYLRPPEMDCPGARMSTRQGAQDAFQNLQRLVRPLGSELCPPPARARLGASRRRSRRVFASGSTNNPAVHSLFQAHPYCLKEGDLTRPIAAKLR